MIVKATLNADQDGYTDQHCPCCGLDFKVDFAQGSDLPIGYCPYCNYHGQFWTPNQEQYLDLVAHLSGIAPPPKAPPDSGNGFDPPHTFTCQHADAIKVKKKDLQPAGNRKKYIHCIIDGERFSI